MEQKSKEVSFSWKNYFTLLFPFCLNGSEHLSNEVSQPFNKMRLFVAISPMIRCQNINYVEIEVKYFANIKKTHAIKDNVDFNHKNVDFQFNKV